ncbi:LysR family transcriptional regulator [Pseudoduganella namucuonensis]|uniref:Transcriptional regulator, LysR family n=1 Tax=Pseudoduganella namucuonensis TaxID=1035707 RepID=A0A1I7L2R9_9BURK|nr:LysR family transcriptional regulator [Pseudoduganella namucuonensis]SFV04072.1 transcriptional regulator, LysR family [Pseudoduganella namucuonensis]
MDHAELNLSQLRTFVAAADHMSFIGAADAVHRSQAAVSMQIMKLEEAVGQALFARHTRRIELTAAGERLLPYARQMLHMESQAVAALRTQEVVGRVVLGAPDDYVSSLLPPVLERFAQLFANVEIELVCLQSLLLKPMLQKGRIDLAFVTRDDDMTGAFIRREPMVWVGSPRHAVWNKSPLPVALYEKGCVARAHTLRALEKSGKPYCATYSSPSLLGILAMVEAGLAVAALAECSVPPHLARLGKAEGLMPVEPLDIVLIKGRKNGSPAAECLASEIMAALSLARG